MKRNVLDSATRPVGVCAAGGLSVSAPQSNRAIRNGQERVPPNAVFFAAVATKEEKIEMEGEGRRGLPERDVPKIQLDEGHEVLGYTAGKMRRFRIKIFPR